MKNSTKRILKGWLMPLILGVLFTFTYSTLSSLIQGDFLSDKEITFNLKSIIVILSLLALYLLSMIYFFFAALFIVGLQSLVCSVFIEKWLNPKVNKNAVFLSICVVLGILSSLLLAILFEQYQYHFLVLGALQGFIVGWVLRRDYLNQTMAE